MSVAYETDLSMTAGRETESDPTVPVGTREARSYPSQSEELPIEDAAGKMMLETG